ncbi:MAG: SDR family oxidoreductase [Alphaproteobacteria bacterium]|nr:SDR family oxidoreductase [Alphaproteobacteria bacterium]
MSNDYLDQLFSLEGQVALVAGASSGIGAEFARGLARAGADVVLCARRADRIEALAKDIAEETGRRTLALSMDVKSQESVEAAFTDAEDQLGTPTVVCSNAGVGHQVRMLEETEEQWDHMMDTNLKGMWRVGRVAAKHMMSAGLKGSIINTASILGLGVTNQHLSYATSKAGVVQMTRAMALELQRYGIRVNAICPGFFVTEINEEGLNTERGQQMLAMTPARRAGELPELVPAMLMLASPASSFTTGVALPVDGAHSVKLVP